MTIAVISIVFALFEFTGSVVYEAWEPPSHLERSFNGDPTSKPGTLNEILSKQLPSIIQAMPSLSVLVFRPTSTIPPGYGSVEGTKEKKSVLAE